jgi:hypothetical protein
LAVVVKVNVQTVTVADLQAQAADMQKKSVVWQQDVLLPL